MKYPRGSSLRPSSGRVRSAIFSILESAGADQSRVLDLYAGTGSFGIEALSRGAEWVDFVEQDPKHAAVIKANLAATGMEGRARVHRQSVERAMGSLDGSYGVIFLDPPYGEQGLDAVLGLLARSPLTREDTLVLVEHSKHRSLGERYSELVLRRTRRYGDTVISIFQKEAKP